MKEKYEKLIIVGFVLFCGGGIIKVSLQAVALLLLNNSIAEFATNFFAWIYPLAALTGLACFLLSYITKKS